MRQSLGANAVSAEAINAARASLPSNQEAVRLYAEGRAKLWAFDFQGARDLLIKAVAADPNYPSDAFRTLRSLVAHGLCR